MNQHAGYSRPSLFKGRVGSKELDSSTLGRGKMLDPRPEHGADQGFGVYTTIAGS